MKRVEDLRARAMKIPSGTIEADLAVLEALYKHSALYFNFCLSRFAILAKEPATLKVLRSLIESERDSEKYIPLFDVAISHVPRDECVSWVLSLLDKKKAPIASDLLIQPRFPEFSLTLCSKLFEMIPTQENGFVLTLRDNIVFQQINNGEYKFVVGCLRKIPVTLDSLFLSEFMLIAAYLLESGYKSKEFIDLLITVSLSIQDPTPLVELLSAKGVVMPAVFVDWISSVIQDAPHLEKENVELRNQPPLLRMMNLNPVQASTDGPRLCRAAKDGRDREKAEIKRRILQEQDPRMLHDYLLAYSRFVKLPRDLPFWFTLLAYRASRTPSLVNQFLSEFSKIGPDAPVGTIVAAAKGIELVAKTSQDSVPKVFPQVRRLMRLYPRVVQIPLLNAMASAVFAGQLEHEFIWKEYHSIRTIGPENLDADDLIHYCLLALNDPDDQDFAVDIIRELNKRDTTSVISGLWRIPREKNPLIDLLPNCVPSPFQKNDPLPTIVKEELTKEMTVARSLLIATAYAVFYDVLPQEEEWMKILAAAGRCVLNFDRNPEFVQQLRCNLKHASNWVRFASVFALDVLIAHGLTDGTDHIEDLKHVLSDESGPVKVSALYGLSLCRIENAQAFVEGYASSAGKRSKEELIGLGYCINSWFSDLIPFLGDPKKRQCFKGSVIWPFISTLCVFLGEECTPLFNPNDPLQLAGFIYLQKDSEACDELVQDLMKMSVDEEIMMTALCGYVPEMVFRIPRWCENERRRLLLTKCVGPEYELLLQLLTRDRPFHKPPAGSEKAVGLSVQPSVQTIREKWRELQSSEWIHHLRLLGPQQIRDLINDDGGYSLIVAIRMRLTEDVARMLMSHKQDIDMLSTLKDFYEDPGEELVPAMMRLKGDLVRVGDILVYYKTGELVSEELTASLLPCLIADLSPSTDIVHELKRISPDWLSEFGQCLIVKHPEWFKQNPENFSLLQ